MPIPPATLVTFPAAPGDGGSAPLLEGRLLLPDPGLDQVGVAVLSHPHPAFGGSMDVWLLPTIAERLAADGWAALRYNVRGVGGSEAGPGDWDGAAEQLDVAGAVAFAKAQAGQQTGGRVALVGWSFGALLGLLHGPTDPSVTDWVGIAPPTRAVEGVPMVPWDRAAVAAWPARRSVIVGDHDQHFPPDTVGSIRAGRVHVVEGADHFLFDRDREVAALVAGCLAPDASTARPRRGMSRDDEGRS